MFLTSVAPSTCCLQGGPGSNSPAPSIGRGLREEFFCREVLLDFGVGKKQRD